MLYIDFSWLQGLSRNRNTKEFLKKLETLFERANKRSKIIIVNARQKTPLRIGRWKLWLNSENEIDSIGTFQEMFEDKAHQQLRNFPSNGDKIIVDLGANEGYYTLAVKQKSPNAKIISVEANPIAFKLLQKNIKENKLKNVFTLNRVVTNREGQVNFEIVKGVTAIGGLKVQGKRSWLPKNYIKKVKLKSTTLESICKKLNINKIDLLKLDVEGSEYVILSSSRNILKNTRKVVVEVHSSELRSKVKKLLRGLGFYILKEEKRAMGDIYFAKA